MVVQICIQDLNVMSFGYIQCVSAQELDSLHDSGHKPSGTRTNQISIVWFNVDFMGKFDSVFGQFYL